MSDEIRAAAERLRRDDYHYEDCATMWNFSYQRSSDICALADAYLAANPSDGDEPVTEEWLNASYRYCDNGSSNRAVSGWLCGTADTCGCKLSVRLVDFGDGEFLWEAVNHEEGCEPEWNKGIGGDAITTRAQLRNLLAALGVA